MGNNIKTKKNIDLSIELIGATKSFSNNIRIVGDSLPKYNFGPLIKAQMPFKNINTTLKQIQPIVPCFKPIIPTNGMNKIIKDAILGYDLNNKEFKKSLENLSKATIQINNSLLKYKAITLTGADLVNVLPKSIVTPINTYEESFENISKLQELCLLKFVEHADQKFSNKLKRLSKIDAEIMFNSSIEFDENINRFLYDDKQIGLTRIKDAVKYSTLFDDISLDEIMDFIRESLDFPGLQSEHPVGKRIFEAIKERKDEYSVKLKNHKFFRARELGTEELYMEQEMRIIPFGASSHGRFNSVGQSVYYLAEKSESACSEVIKHKNGTETKFKLQVDELENDRELTVFDIRKLDNQFSKECQKSLTNYNENSRIKKGYVLPNYLASCIKKCGIDGIMYNVDGKDLYAFFEDRAFKYLNSEIKIF